MGDIWLAARIAAERTRWWAVASRLLGPTSAANTAVQAAWQRRRSRADTRDVEHLSGWLTTVAARTARDTGSRQV